MNDNYAVTEVFRADIAKLETENKQLKATNAAMKDALEDLIPLIRAEYPEQADTWLGQALAALRKTR